MLKLVRHIFVCTNRRAEGAPCCAAKGSEELLKALKMEVAKAKLKGVVRVNESKCLDQCDRGCTAVVYPEATWYGHLTLEDVPALVRHIVNGEVHEAKVLKDE